MRSLLWRSCDLPNQRIQRIAKSATPFAIAKVPPLFAAADADVIYLMTYGAQYGSTIPDKINRKITGLY